MVVVCVKEEDVEADSTGSGVISLLVGIALEEHFSVSSPLDVSRV